MTFLDFFAGIGGFRAGLEAAGHNCVGFCEFDKFAVASYTSMHLITDEQRKYLSTMSMKQRQKEILKEEYRNGEWYAPDVRTIDVETMPKADCWCFGFPCFVAGTLIRTSDGLKPIEEIKTGDMVLTHKNRFRKVLIPMMNKKKGLYYIKIQGSVGVCLTGNHPLYVRYSRRVWSSKQKKYIRTWTEPEWKQVKDLNGNEYLLFPKSPTVSNRMNLSSDQCWLLGRYVADGYLRDYKRKDRDSKSQSVIFCIGNNKRLEFENKLDGYTYCKDETSQSCTKYILGQKHHDFFRLCESCGKGAENKIIPDFIMDLPDELLESFLNGYLSGDGCKIGNYYSAISVSKKLIYQIGEVVQRLYHTPYGIYLNNTDSKSKIQGREVNMSKSYQIRFKKEVSAKDRGCVVNDELWMPIKSIHFDETREEFVYNMEVEEDHSYVANGIAAHNCQDISVAGNQKGLKGERSGLFYAVTDLIRKQKEEDRPKYLFIENVKNLLSVNGGWDFLKVLTELDEIGYDAVWRVINSSDFVPQNRERVFIVGCLRSKSSGKVFRFREYAEENSNSVKQIGHWMSDKRDNPNQYRTYATDGISPALNTCGGGKRTTHCDKGRGGLNKFCDLSIGFGLKLTDKARCIPSRYYKGATYRKGENSGVAVFFNEIGKDQITRGGKLFG